MNIIEKLDEARRIIRNTKLEKDGRNTYSGYSYFTPERIEALVADACEKTKTICLISFKADQYGYFQELKLIDMESVSDGLLFELRTERGDIKATNTTQQMGGTDTYSERYIKMKVFSIKDNNLDFDSQDNRAKPASVIRKPVEPKHRDVGIEDAQQDMGTIF